MVKSTQPGIHARESVLRDRRSQRYKLPRGVAFGDAGKACAGSRVRALGLAGEQFGDGAWGEPSFAGDAGRAYVAEYG